MFRLLTRLGKTSFGQNFMPFLTMSTTIAYSSVHLFFHDQVHEFYAAQSPSGRREKISDHLQSLIRETLDQALEFGLGDVDPLLHREKKITNTVIRWFMASTLEPVSFGSSLLTSGSIVGLPIYYNYTTPDDIPDSAFDIKKISLFRSTKPLDQQIQELDANLDKSSETKWIRRIGRNTDEGQDYINSLLLSEDAKRYSIARELFLADTYKPVFKISLYTVSIMLALASGRSAVQLLKLKQRHITHRLPFYMISGFLGLGNYRIISSFLEESYAHEADTRAKAMGEQYERGAEEYFKKRATRNRILQLDA